MARVAEPRVGEPAPDFLARTTDGRDMRLSDLRGRFVVIYFFPKAFTPGCMAETTRFRDAYPDIRALGGEVLGISVDDHETQCDFADATRASFPMIGDDEKEISRRYGVIRPFLRFDKRVTFVIDPDGIVQGVFHHEFQVSKHLDEALMLLEKLRENVGA